VIHAAFDRLKDDAGLEWITVVAIAIGLRILSWVAGDLKHLSEATLRIGDGQLDWQVGIQRPDEIGQLAKSFETMQQRLQTDELTVLANRDAFMLRLCHKISRAADKPDDERFAVLFIDLNHFKHINDHYGHGVGDRVLIEVAQRLRATVRSQDLAARLSGDEFVILLDRVANEEGLERVRRQIQAALKEPLLALGKDALASTDFGGSVGEALSRATVRTAESLLKKADRRMYSQKFTDRPESPAHPLRRSSD